MARPLRIEYEGAFYHVMNRGINHQNIFLKNSHRKDFLNLLRDISLKFNIEVHSYCLMDNHYHLLIKTPHANLSKAMRHLDGVYTRRFNIDENKDGPIFKGRYQSILVEEEAYLLQVSRYIHLNPVTAGLCAHPVEYLWSSYAEFINKKESWLKTELILSYFGSIKSYNKFVSQGVDEGIKKLYQDSSIIFGSENFIKKHLSKTSQNQKKHCLPDIRKTMVTPSIEKISLSIAKYYSVTIDDLKKSKRAKLNLPRKMAILISRRYGQFSHREIADYFGGILSNSMSTMIHRLEKYISSSQELKNDLEKILKINFDCND